MDRCDGIPIDRVAFSKQLQQLAESGGTRRLSSMSPATDRNGRCLVESCSRRSRRSPAISMIETFNREIRRHSPSQRLRERRCDACRLAAGSVLRIHVPQGTDEERNHIHALFERKLLISTWDCDDEDCISQQDVRNWIRGEFPHGAEILPFFACEPSRAIPTGGSSGKPKLVVQKVRPATARWICRLGRR